MGKNYDFMKYDMLNVFLVIYETLFKFNIENCL